MKSKAFFNKAMAIMTALTVAIQPSTAFANVGAQNPTEATAKVKYEGVDAYYSAVVPTTIQLGSNGMAEFSVMVEGDLGDWGVGKMGTATGEVPILGFNVVAISIYTKDEEGVRYSGCYLKQDGKEPIFAEFHEEVWNIAVSNNMEQNKIENYKDSKAPCIIKFCNTQPDWVRNLTNDIAKYDKYDEYIYAGMNKEQFSHCYFGYDMGTEVPITVNLEGNKAVPAGDWKGEIVIEINTVASGFIPVIDEIPKAKEAYDELTKTDTDNDEGHLPFA